MPPRDVFMQRPVAAAADRQGEPEREREREREDRMGDRDVSVCDWIFERCSIYVRGRSPLHPRLARSLARVHRTRLVTAI